MRCLQIFDVSHLIGSLPLHDDAVPKEAEAAAFLLDLFASADKDKSGYLPRDTLSQILTDADLGLSHVQIQAMASESVADDKGMVQYESFAVTAATMFAKIFDFRLELFLILFCKD